MSRAAGHAATVSRAAGRKAAAGHSIFAMPILIAVITLAGLVAGLLGNGFFDILSWIGLIVPVTVIAWALHSRRG